METTEVSKTEAAQPSVDKFADWMLREFHEKQGIEKGSAGELGQAAFYSLITGDFDGLVAIARELANRKPPAIEIYDEVRFIQCRDCHIWLSLDTIPEHLKRGPVLELLSFDRAIVYSSMCHGYFDGDQQAWLTLDGVRVQNPTHYRTEGYFSGGAICVVIEGDKAYRVESIEAYLRMRDEAPWPGRL